MSASNPQWSDRERPDASNAVKVRNRYRKRFEYFEHVMRQLTAIARDLAWEKSERFMRPSRRRYADRSKPIDPQVQSLIDSERFRHSPPGGRVETNVNVGVRHRAGMLVLGEWVTANTAFWSPEPTPEYRNVLAAMRSVEPPGPGDKACPGCGTKIVRRGKRGPLPKRCPECEKAHQAQARQKRSRKTDAQRKHAEAFAARMLATRADYIARGWEGMSYDEAFELQAWEDDQTPSLDAMQLRPADIDISDLAPADNGFMVPSKAEDRAHGKRKPATVD